MTSFPRQAPGYPQRLGWDALQLAIAASLMLQVWRLHDLFPVLRIFGLPIAATLLPLLLLALDADPRRRLRFPGPPVQRIVYGIVALVVLSIPASLYPGASATFLLMDYWRSVAGMIVVAAVIRGLADIERVVWLQVVGAALFCGVVLSRFTPNADGRWDELEYYDSNDLALLIVCTLPLTVYLLRRSRGVKRLVAVGATIYLMLALVKTGSRGGFLGLLAAIAYMVFFLRSVPLPKRLGAVAFVVVLLGLFSTDRYWDMMQTILHPTSDYNWAGQAENGRMEVWKRGLGYMVTHPFLGVGAGAFPSAEGTLAPQADRQQTGIGWKWSEAHNSFVQIGAELGIFGLVLFVGLLVAAFRALALVGRGPPTNATFLAQTLGASLAAYVVSGFFLSAAYSAYLYVLIGMVVGLAKVAAPAAVRPPDWPDAARRSWQGATRRFDGGGGLRP